uniref:Uncharacterized protein n=1 Tax=viral metagenome TaxID=1070528 RepID=A0A6C0J2B3_9ZZZZ
MSNRIEEYFKKDAQHLEYGFMAFMALIFMRLLSESLAAKTNRQTKKNKLLFESMKMKYMAKMSMAAAADRGGGGGGGGSNKK